MFTKILKRITHGHQPHSDLFSKIRLSQLENYYKGGEIIKGFAQPEQTTRFSFKNKNNHPDNWKSPFNSKLILSRIGIGTYVGKPDEQDDLKMFNAIIQSIQSKAINVIDTSINYRYMKSQRVVGAALRYLIDNGYSRQQLFICTKGGYIPQDHDNKKNISQMKNEIIRQTCISQQQIVRGVHCVNPAFINNQIEMSLKNMGVQSIDLYYLHNFGQSQLPIIGKQKFYYRLAKAFEKLEQMVQKNKIRNYGLATWTSFRSPPEKNQIHLSLEQVYKTAQKVNKNHHFRYIQVPINMMMPQVFGHAWQPMSNQKNVSQLTSLIILANHLKINIISSSPLMQGSLINIPLSTSIFKCMFNGAKHLQFLRSMPNKSLLSKFKLLATLIGQKQSRHVKSNLQVCQVPQLTQQQWLSFVKANATYQKPQQKMQ